MRWCKFGHVTPCGIEGEPNPRAPPCGSKAHPDSTALSSRRVFLESEDYYTRETSDHVPEQMRDSSHRRSDRRSPKIISPRNARRDELLPAGVHSCRFQDNRLRALRGWRDGEDPAGQSLRDRAKRKQLEMLHLQAKAILWP